MLVELQTCPTPRNSIRHNISLDQDTRSTKTKGYLKLNYYQRFHLLHTLFVRGNALEEICSVHCYLVLMGKLHFPKICTGFLADPLPASSLWLCISFLVWICIFLSFQSTNPIFCDKLKILSLSIFLQPLT